MNIKEETELTVNFTPHREQVTWTHEGRKGKAVCTAGLESKVAGIQVKRAQSHITPIRDSLTLSFSLGIDVHSWHVN